MSENMENNNTNNPVSNNDYVPAPMPEEEPQNHSSRPVNPDVQQAPKHTPPVQSDVPSYTPPMGGNYVPPVQQNGYSGQQPPQNGFATQQPPQQYYQNSYAYQYAQRKNISQKEPGDGMAIAALILGISGIVLSCCSGIGIICGILAVIFGILSFKKKTAKNGMTLTGIILGGISIVISIVMIIYIVVSMPFIMREIERGIQEFEDNYSYYSDDYEDYYKDYNSRSGKYFNY